MGAVPFFVFLFLIDLQFSPDRDVIAGNAVIDFARINDTHPPRKDMIQRGFLVKQVPIFVGPSDRFRRAFKICLLQRLMECPLAGFAEGVEISGYDAVFD